MDKLFENISITLYEKLINEEKIIEDALTQRIALKKEDFPDDKEKRKKKYKKCC